MLNKLTDILGGVAERLKAAVLKTVECQSSVGSNPTPSARKFNRVEFHGWLMAFGLWLIGSYCFSQWLPANSYRYFD